MRDSAGGPSERGPESGKQRRRMPAGTARLRTIWLASLVTRAPNVETRSFGYLQERSQGRHPDTRREGGREIRRRDVLQKADPELPSRDPAGRLSSCRWSAPLVLLGAARGLVALARPLRMPAPGSDGDSVPDLIACHDLDSTRYPHLLIFIGVFTLACPLRRKASGGVSTNVARRRSRVKLFRGHPQRGRKLCSIRRRATT